MSTMRIGGLASGMDIDSIVEKLMVAERMPMDKLEQQKQIYEWQRDAYRDVNKKMTTLDTYIADNFILKSLNTKTATSSNSDLVSAVATGSASGSLSIEKVTQLAEAARGIGNKVDGLEGKTTLSSLFESGKMPTTFTLRAINREGKLGEAVSIGIDKDTTVSEFITKINGSNAGVSAIFENGQLSITAKNTGKAVKEDGVTPTDAMTTDTDGTALFNKLGLSQLVSAGSPGKNAEFQVNGIVTERTTNAFSLNGYNITLKAEFSTNPVTMTSSTNVDEIMNKVKEFVATYNGFIKDLTDQTKQPKYRDFKPLTELQKKAMEEKEIENWETRSKSGLLRNDSIITSGLSSLRGLVYQTNHAVTNQKFNALYTIGIGTSKDYNSGGTLEIDETKLRKALEEDPDAVVQLLTMSGEKSATVTKADGTTVQSDTRGFMRKIRDEIDIIEKKIDERAGRGSMTETQYTLGKYLRNVNQSLDAWKDKLTKIEDRYWKQFGAMEAMINKANSQSASLMSQYY